MRLWKPLLIIVPLGMGLGLAGGYMARPVLKQSAPSDEPWRKDDGSRIVAPSAFGQPEPYDGAYSYAPEAGSQVVVGWPPPAGDGFEGFTNPAPNANDPSDAENITAQNAEAAADAARIAALDAQTVDRPPVASAPGAAPAPPPAPASGPTPPSAEPRTADGKLPAIW